MSRTWARTLGEIRMLRALSASQTVDDILTAHLNVESICHFDFDIELALPIIQPSEIFVNNNEK